MDPLASVEDVQTQLGRDLTTAETARVADILAKASSAFRRLSRQDFTPNTSTVRLKVNGGQIRLEQEPANSVSTVVDDRGNDVGFRLLGQLLFVWDLKHLCPLPSDEFVTVTYSHGGEVPDLVRVTIAELAAKILRIDPTAAAGVTTGTVTTGPFSETRTYAGWAVGGTTMLSPDDQAVALSYRYQGGQVIVMRGA